MISREDIDTTLARMILSASGWRGVFALDGGEESSSDKISCAHKIISGAAARIFAEYLESEKCGVRSEEYKPTILLGTDTRPTGAAIIEAMMPVLLDCGCEVRYAGIVSAPEIMAWARSKNFYCEPHEPLRMAGFIYISASHNPIGHNGIKFGLTDGGVLAAEESVKLINNFYTAINNDDFISKITSIIFTTNHTNTANLPSETEAQVCAGSCENRRFCSWSEKTDEYKNVAYKTYYNFCNEVIWNNNRKIEDVFKESLAKKPLGIVCDFNGSARTVSIDKEFFTSLGFKFECVNNKPGEIVHRIVPEGESLEPCERLLEESHARDASFALGYVPDCDGDRGNLVIFDDAVNKARALEAQEVFALACVAELSHLVWTGELSYGGVFGEALVKAAVVVNDPTSMRTDRIAECFGISVFRAETGEANVVTLARNLRNEGYIVRILGEGSAGGNITHPSAVRDPLNTVMAIAKMLSIRSTVTQSGLFEIWCKYSKQTEKYKIDFNLSDIIASLPPFITTPAYHKDAVLRIKSKDHGALKDRYQKVFLREWEGQKDELKTRFYIYKWEAIAYNGTAEKRKLYRFGDAGRGGLKILFFDSEDKETAYIWMRGSATEPVFRIMADVSGSEASLEKWLLDWQRKMIMEADSSEKLGMKGE